MNDAEQRLSELGLKLPEAPQPVANYVPFLLSGDQLFISGQISKDGAGRVLTGLLGDDVSIEDGQAAARHSALNILAQAKAALGSLDRIAQVLRLTGFVASTPGFSDQPKVINGASDLLVAVLGDAGRHTRSAVGVASLPIGCMRRDRRHPQNPLIAMFDRAAFLRPIAHRGLHNAKKGIIENTGPAFEAAIAKGYGIECDVRPAAGSLPVVFHDETLNRLVDSRGLVAKIKARELKALSHRVGGAPILTFAELLDLVGGARSAAR